MNYEKTIQNFKDTMKVNLIAEDFNILQNNIDNIMINQSQREHTAGTNYTVGGYDFFNRSINLYNEVSTTTIYHELFHASSSYYDRQKEVVFSRFHHHSKEKDIGRGLNEGYTELLTSRYFGNDTDSGYKNETHYANLVEGLIGKEQMQSFYLKSDLDSLISELSKYNSVEAVMQFIDDLDKFIVIEELRKDKIDNFENIPYAEYLAWFDEVNEYISKTYMQLNQFIIDSYINKLYNDPNFEEKKNQLMTMMSAPLTFFNKEYVFDMNSQFGTSSITI